MVYKWTLFGRTFSFKSHYLHFTGLNIHHEKKTLQKSTSNLHCSSFDANLSMCRWAQSGNLYQLMLVVNACRCRTNSLLFDFGGRLICKLCHIVASHFPPRSPKQLVALLGEGSATYCRERAWMHRQITALKHSGHCVSCELKHAGSFHRWMRTDCCLTYSLFSEASFRSRRYANAHVSTLKTFLIICRTGGPSRGMMGRPWRLSALRGCQWLTLPRAGFL